MTEEWPKTDNHYNFINQMEKKLDQQGEMTRTEIAIEIQKELDLGKHTLKRWMSEHRESLEKQGFETVDRQDGTPGDPTTYWRIK